MTSTPQEDSGGPRQRAGRPLRRWLGAALLCGLATAAAQEGPVTRLRIVGGLAGLDPYSRHEEPFWTRQLPQLSAGRYAAEIVPYDRAGIRGQDMLSLIKTGVVAFGTVLLSQAMAQEPELAAPDLAGLNPDMASLRRSVAAYRPNLEALLRRRYGIELLAVYAYPAQLLYCKGPAAGFHQLAGRRVRTMGASQSDLVQALGAKPIVMRMAEVPEALRQDQLDCVIASAMAGHAIGLPNLTGHLHATAIDWGLSIFAVNAAAWAALPADLRALLRRELPRVEAAVWQQALADTAEGIACNTGGAGCRAPRPGGLALVPDGAAERTRLREALSRAVLPSWLQRCGPDCAAAWNGSLRAATGIDAAAR